MFSVASAPDAVVVAGSFDPSGFAAAIRTKNPKVKIIGNSSWSAPQAIDPALDGVVIADLDSVEMETVSARFRARFGRELTPLAAYAYDTIALSAGIAMATGRDGFIRAIIEDRKRIPRRNGHVPVSQRRQQRQAAGALSGGEGQNEAGAAAAGQVLSA